MQYKKIILISALGSQAFFGIIPDPENKLVEDPPSKEYQAEFFRPVVYGAQTSSVVTINR